MKNIFKIEIDKNRVFGLDILRTFAILFVVIEHGAYLLPKKFKAISELFTFDGVSIFFVLSGFLIGGILIKIVNKNGMSLHILLNFWIRRWFRTLPAYFLILILLSIVHLLFAKGFTLESISAYFIFSQNLIQPHPAWFPEAWSLSVEEWFYLIVPVLLAALLMIGKIKPRQAILLTSVIIIIAVTGFRYYRYSTVVIETVSDWDLLFRKQVVTRLDSLMYGVFGAYINYYYYDIWIKHKKKLFLLGVIIFLFAKFVCSNLPVDGVFFAVLSFSLFSFATLLLLPFLSEFKTGKGYLFLPITYISLISYSMYLLNLSVIQQCIIKKIPWHIFFQNEEAIAFSKYGAYWLLLIPLSILLYKYFEIPMTKLRDHVKLKN